MLLRSFVLLWVLFAFATVVVGQTPSTTVSDPDDQQLRQEFKRAKLNPQARVAVEQGVEFLKAKDYKKAVNALTAAVRMHPNSGQFRHLLGVAYFKNGQAGQAWLQFRRAVILRPTLKAAVRDFEAVWSVFVRRGVFDVGSSQQRVTQLVGEPDRKQTGTNQEIWQYGFMHLQFVKGVLVAIVDPRGIGPDIQFPVDVMDVKFDDPARWRLGHRARNRLHELSEYVPKEQTARQWEEMVQVQVLFRLGQNSSPAELMANIEKQLTVTHPKAQFAALAQNDREAVFHWNSPGTKEQPAQHEIVRLVRGGRDIHRLAYVRKVAQIPQAEAQTWLGLLRQAKLVTTKPQSSAAEGE